MIQICTNKYEVKLKTPTEKVWQNNTQVKNYYLW